ncbi:MAG TPA: o-succinylbenzoate--CoA ligase, partial [Rhodothermales bacterium]|nr:o-succinylbenzoate--CoA ligase [Rhodothermales bacterium]
TGRPKAALLSWGNLYYNALGSNRNIPLGPGDRWLLSLPLYHVGGLGILMRCFLAGAAVALPERGAPIGQSIAALGVTHVSMVTTQLVRLLRHGGSGQLAGLRAILLGGSAFPSALLEEARALQVPIHTSYGLTEMASQVTTTPPDADALELATSGQLLEYRELHISDEGEILVGGETLFQGYVDGDELYRPVDADGWFHTGDLGALDARGSLTVLGRRDNMFISGGENVQPEEIEQVLCRIPGVEQAVVVPVPDAEFGFRPAAFVQAAPGSARPSEYAAVLSGMLPRFKVPVAFFDWTEADTGERMKVDREELARRAADALGRG